MVPPGLEQDAEPPPRARPRAPEPRRSLLSVWTVAGIAIAIAYFALAPEFDVPTSARAAPETQATIAGAAIAWCATCAALVVPAWRLALAAGLVVAGLSVADVGAAATGVEALAYGAAGGVFAAFFGSATLAGTLPAFIGVLALATGTEPVLDVRASVGDPTALALPGWGAVPDSGALSLAEPLLCGAFVALAAQLDLRPALTGLAAAVAFGLAAFLDVPPLALLGASFYVANADRLGRLLRA